MKVLRALTTEAPEGAVVANTGHDDAAVVRWPASCADGPYHVSTIDVITPVVDDPYTFGAVAAANALSDVYAVGGTPRFALAFAAFPSDALPLDVLQAILQGGADKAREAGALVVGGHTVKGAVPMYGLAVHGEVSARALVTQAGARPGDALVLTKPLGAGLLVAAHRRDELAADEEAALLASMLRLNARAAHHMVALGARAATDVTGFGLSGHALHVARASGVALVLEASALPALPGARERAASARVGGAARCNLDYVASALSSRASDAALRLAIDPQTSGGLLVALEPDAADELVRQLRDEGHDAARIGEVRAGAPSLTLVP